MLNENYPVQCLEKNMKNESDLDFLFQDEDKIESGALSTFNQCNDQDMNESVEKFKSTDCSDVSQTDLKSLEEFHNKYNYDFRKRKQRKLFQIPIEKKKRRQTREPEKNITNMRVNSAKISTNCVKIQNISKNNSENREESSSFQSNFDSDINSPYGDDVNEQKTEYRKTKWWKYRNKKTTKSGKRKGKARRGRPRKFSLQKKLSLYDDLYEQTSDYLPDENRNSEKEIFLPRKLRRRVPDLKGVEKQRCSLRIKAMNEIICVSASQQEEFYSSHVSIIKQDDSCKESTPEPKPNFREINICSQQSPNIDKNGDTRKSPPKTPNKRPLTIRIKTIDKLRNISESMDKALINVSKCLSDEDEDEDEDSDSPTLQIDELDQNFSEHDNRDKTTISTKILQNFNNFEGNYGNGEATVNQTHNIFTSISNHQTSPCEKSGHVRSHSIPFQPVENIDSRFHAYQPQAGHLQQSRIQSIPINVHSSNCLPNTHFANSRTSEPDECYQDILRNCFQNNQSNSNFVQGSNSVFQQNYQPSMAHHIDRTNIGLGTAGYNARLPWYPTNASNQNANNHAFWNPAVHQWTGPNTSAVPSMGEYQPAITNFEAFSNLNNQLQMQTPSRVAMDFNRRTFNLEPNTTNFVESNISSGHTLRATFLPPIMLKDISPEQVQSMVSRMGITVITPQQESSCQITEITEEEEIQEPRSRLKESSTQELDSNSSEHDKDETQTTHIEDINTRVDSESLPKNEESRLIQENRNDEALEQLILKKVNDESQEGDNEQSQQKTQNVNQDGIVSPINTPTYDCESCGENSVLNGNDIDIAHISIPPTPLQTPSSKISSKSMSPPWSNGPQSLLSCSDSNNSRHSTSSEGTDKSSKKWRTGKEDKTRSSSIKYRNTGFLARKLKRTIKNSIKRYFNKFKKDLLNEVRTEIRKLLDNQK